MNTTLQISGENDSFIGNKAQNGGVICAEYSTVQIYTQTLSIVNNIAADSGGAMHLLSSHLIILLPPNALVISGNRNNNRGAVYATDSNLQMLDLIKIWNNSASISGGGLYLRNTTLEVSGNNTSIAYNTANFSGG